MARHILGVSGESFRNADGSDRQAIIRRMMPGDALDLRPENDNPHDRNAIGVWSREGMIGYIPRDDAPWLRAAMAKSKHRVSARVMSIGAPPNARSKALLGVVIEVALGSDAVQSPARPPQQGKNGLLGCARWFVIGIVGLIGLASMMGHESATTGGDTSKGGVSETDARMACMRAIRPLATHPSTIDWGVLGSVAQQDQKGGWAIRQPFSARNAYNLEIGYVSYCAVDVSGDARIVETKEADR